LLHITQQLEHNGIPLIVIEVKLEEGHNGDTYMQIYCYFSNSLLWPDYFAEGVVSCQNFAITFEQ